MSDRVSIRIRIDGTSAATFTIKGVKPGIERNEFEFPMPVADADELLAQCEGAVITKVRHLVPIGTFTFEIDVFEGENAGLVIAEIELQRTDQAFEHPPWLGAEVTQERRYYNADLARHPSSRW
jgi:adenylate cyclase